MGSKLNLINQKFGRLTVISEYENNGIHTRWLCMCSCGNEKVVVTTYLKNGYTKSCGCLRKEMTGNRGKLNKKHGFRKTNDYTIWKNIKARCYNVNSQEYKNYGNRGIKLHNEWINDAGSFINYIRLLPDYGKKDYSLDRINNDGDYVPDNLRWATNEEQSQNTRFNTVNVDIVKTIRELYGKMDVKEISKRLNITTQRVHEIGKVRTWRNV